jgi:hypothetical protein
MTPPTRLDVRSVRLIEPLIHDELDPLTPGPSPKGEGRFVTQLECDPVT